jgi:hypothetical protein
METNTTTKWKAKEETTKYMAMNFLSSTPKLRVDLQSLLLEIHLLMLKE